MKTREPSPLIFRLIPAILFFLIPAGVLAQETGTCAEKLKNAQSFFEKGQVEEVPGLLKDCLKSGFKKEEELTAYKLLIQTYLLYDKLELADSTMFEFLRKNPEYQVSPTDHSSFVYLFNNFRVRPVVQIAVHAGINIPFLTFLSPVMLGGEPGKSDISRNIGNLYISAESKFRISNKLEINAEIGYSQLKFSNKVDFQNHGIVDYNESQSRLEIPVTLAFDITSFGKFTVYGRTGMGAALNMGVTSIASQTMTDVNNPNDRTGQSLDRKDSRIALDLFAQLGGGIKYKISKGFLFSEIRTNFGILEQNSGGGSTIQELDWYYAWGDPQFRMNAVNINFGYTFIFYKPSKSK